MQPSDTRAGKPARGLGSGLVLVGIVFAVGGAIWLLTGRYTAIGLSQVTVGLVFILMGIAATRRAAATVSHATAPPPPPPPPSQPPRRDA